MGLPTIFDEDIDALTSRLQTALETTLGRSLAPADIEILIANCFAYELQLLRIAGNNVMRQNLIDFSTAPMLDLLTALVGVVRLPAAPSVCTLQFNIVAGSPSSVVVPAGTRVQSVDGKAVFQTVADVTATPGVVSVTVQGTCETVGSAGNGYTAGNVNILLDPQAFITSALNIDTTNSGIDAETDDQLRSRAKLAPASFSVAGPTEAYVFFAKSAHPSIVDVDCKTTNPGEVTLYPLCTGGTLPSTEILNAVLATCSDKKVRPQNDTVLVAAPTQIDYAINIGLILTDTAIDAVTIAAATAALQAYVDDNQNSLGIDVVVSELIALAKIEGQVYDLVVTSPSANVVADENEFTTCTGITVTVTGVNNG